MEAGTQGPQARTARRERAVLALLFAWLAVTICSYYVLRPVRSALVLSEFGPQALPWVYMGTALFTGLAVWIYSRFTHLPRRLLLGGVLAFFILNFAGWWRLSGLGLSWTSPAFYIWVDVFSIMGPTMFWIYVNDLYPPLDAKRVFGLIGAAGPAGAIVGAALTRSLVGRLGAVNMLLVAGGLYGVALALFAALEALTEGRSAAHLRTLERFEKYDFSEFTGVMRSIFASRVLFLLTAVVCFERLVPDFVDYIFNRVAHDAYPDAASFAAFYASFDFWRNVAALAATLLLTSPVLKRLGVHVALAAVPATILVGAIGFAVVPSLAVIVAMKGLEEGQRHAWFKAGKEVIYTATNTEVIYKVKSYVEMFFYRFARGAAGLLILLGASGLGLGTVGMSLLAVPLAAAWAAAAWRLGKTYEALEAGAVLSVAGREATASERFAARSAPARPSSR